MPACKVAMGLSRVVGPADTADVRCTTADRSPVSQVVSGYGQEPVATSATLAYLCCLPLLEGLPDLMQ